MVARDRDEIRPSSFWTSPALVCHDQFVSEPWTKAALGPGELPELPGVLGPGASITARKTGRR